MNASKKCNFHKAIIFTKVLNDKTLVVVDSDTSIYYVDLLTKELKSSFDAKISHERYETNIIDFSSDGKKFVSLSSNTLKSIYCDAQTKKLISKFDKHKGEISCIRMDPSDRFIITGGDNGKVYAIDIKSGQLAFTLPNHIDTVNDIVFSQKIGRAHV